MIQVEDEKMIFLDANAFYSYYGRSKLGMTSEPVDEERGLSTLFQTNFFRLFFRYCTGV